MTIIITGGNRGLGYETALALAADTSRTIVLAGHNSASTAAAAQRIQSITGNTQVEAMRLDLAELASVRTFAADFKSRNLPPLTTLICNAGVSKISVQERSVDGFEITFAVNHLGHYLLTTLLLDSLQAPARIIFVSSGVHDPANARGPMQPPRYTKAEWLAYPERNPDCPVEASAAGGQAYANSKLCNVLCAYELDRRLTTSNLSTSGKPITVNAFDPGMMVGTGLGRYNTGMMRFMWFTVMPLLSRLKTIGRTVAQSGSDLAYLTTDPALTAVSGKYFSGREMLPSSDDSYDLEKAVDLWQTSINLTHLQSNETILPLEGTP